MFKKNPKLKPSQVFLNCVVKAISGDKTWDEINAVCESVVYDKNNRNLKNKAAVSEIHMDIGLKRRESLNKKKQTTEIAILSTRLTVVDLIEIHRMFSKQVLSKRRCAYQCQE